MRNRTSGLILAGILATGAAGAVAMTPASAATSDNPVVSRLAGIKSALSGLVTDGTLTKAQADKVAATLDSKLPQRGDGGFGGHFGRMGMTQVHEAAAKALGLTTDKLHTALESGKSLADVAKDQKVSVTSLVKAMVSATETQLATAVKDGNLTQAQANTIKSTLTQRITDHVNGVRPNHSPGRDRSGVPGDAESSSSAGSLPLGTSGTSSIPLGTI